MSNELGRGCVKHGLPMPTLISCFWEGVFKIDPVLARNLLSGSLPTDFEACDSSVCDWAVDSCCDECVF